MNMVWNWDPFFNAVNGAIKQYSDQTNYQNAVNGLFGSGSPIAQQANLPQQTAQMPSMQTPGGANIGGGQMALNLPPLMLPPPLPDARGKYPSGTPMTYDGPVGKALGSRAQAIAPILQAMPPAAGWPLLTDAAKSMMVPQEFDPTPRDGMNPSTGKPGQYLVGKNGAVQWLTSTPEPSNKIAPNGQLYDEHGVFPAGTSFPDPNKAFSAGPNGQPVANAPYQNYEAGLHAIDQAPRWAAVGVSRDKMGQDNYSPPTMIGFSGPDGEEVQKAAIWDKKQGQYLDATNGQPFGSTPNLRVIGNATGGARSQTAISRILTNAEDATSGIENLANIASGGSGGLFPNLQTTPLSALGRAVTPQEVQDVQATMAGLGRAMGGLATGGLAVDQNVQKSYEGLSLNTGDTQLTKMRKLAEMRQQATNALDVQAVNPVLSNDQRNKAAALSARIKKAVPWSVQDVQGLENSQNPNISLRDLAQQKLGQTPGGTSRGVKWRLIGQ